MWKAIPISLVVLSAGCGPRMSSGGYCDLAAPLLFGDTETVEWLNANDRRLLEDIVVHNETHEALC